MNSYTVEWLPEAEDELAALWLGATDRAAVTMAQAQVDRLLGRDPQGNGRYLSEGLYQIDYPPLVVFYTIDEPRRHVEVTWVR